VEVVEADMSACTASLAGSEAGEFRWLEPRVPHIPLMQTYVFWMVVSGNDGYVDEKLMIDGVDMHAVMILIALMSYGHSRAAGPTSSMTRWPPIDENIKCTRWEGSLIVAPWAKISLWPEILTRDSREGSLLVCWDRYLDTRTRCRLFVLGDLP